MDHEGPIRLASFLAVFAAMALWELASPRRVPHVPKGYRWFANLMLVAVGTGVVRIVLPMAAVGAAEWARARGWGLFNLWDAPAWASWGVSVAALDFAIYEQHVVFHRVPVLWRLHKVHHADVDIDVTTGLRFHPLEILLSMAIKMGVVIALGAPAGAVVVFEVVLNATSMFNHSNVKIPFTLDRVLRLIVVTPDMHRVHHSVDVREHNRNFGFNVPWWDRLCGTYQAQPGAGHDGMAIGLAQYQGVLRQTLGWLLTLPFRGASR
ncbi:MAG: sterol desaturase family protein [Candidatus Hydrogenedentales bacterium]|jgi:sterol desaturase/sphingolipid hydroxylase (fatty acid hydroxylase superfamily)